MQFKASQASPSLILGYFQQVKSSLSEVNLATLLNTLASITPAQGQHSSRGGDRRNPPGLVADPVFREILDSLVSQHLVKMDGFGLASVASSLHRLGLRSQDRLWEDLSLAIQEAKPTRFNAQTMGTIVSTYSRLGLTPSGLFEALEAAILLKLPLFDALTIANLAWGFHHVGKGSAELQRMLLLGASGQISRASTEELAVIAMNFARTCSSPSASVNSSRNGALPSSRGPVAELFGRIEQKVQGGVFRLPPSSAVNLVWGFAKVGYRSEPVFREVAQNLHSPQILGTLRPMEISSLSWSFAKVEIPSAELFQNLQEAVINKRIVFEPQHLANIAWAYSRLNVHSPALFSALSKEAKGKMDKFTPLGLANLLAAFAKLKIYDASLTRRIEDRVVKILDVFNPSELSLITWSFAEISELEHRGDLPLDYSKLPANRKELFRQISNTAVEKKSQYQEIYWDTLVQALRKVSQHEHLESLLR